MGQSIFSNAAVAAISRVLVVLLGLVGTALTVRIISVQDFGSYSLVLTIGTFLQLFADFGLYLTASREIGAAQGSKHGGMRYIVSLRLALLLVLFVFGFASFLATPWSQGLSTIFIVIALGLMFQSLSQLMMGVFQAYGSIWKATLGDIAGRSVQVGMLGYFFYYQGGGSVMHVAIAFMVGLCVAFIIHAVLVPHRATLYPQISLSSWRYLVRTSWPIGLMLILNMIYFRSDILILSYFRSGEEVGWYALAFKIIENGLFLPAMLGGLLLPHISAAVASRATARAQTLVSQGLSLSLYTAIIVVAMLVVFSSPIISFIAGPEFIYSSNILRVLSVALAIMFCGNIFGFALIALSEQRKLAVLYGVLVVFNIGANLLFVPQYGALAAAWSTVVTEGIAMTTAAYLVYREISWRIPVVSSFLALFGALVAVYVGYILPSYVHIGFRLAVVGALYLGAGYVFGLWNKEALSVLRTTSSI